LNHGVFCFHRRPGFCWFRLLGWGLRWKDVTRNPLLFSERVLGHGLRLGRWHVAFLSP
jgi:hypothetical protein